MRQSLNEASTRKVFARINPTSRVTFFFPRVKKKNLDALMAHRFAHRLRYKITVRKQRNEGNRIVQIASVLYGTWKENFQI